MEEEYNSYFLIRDTDLIWGPVSLLLLYIFVYNKRKKYRDTELFRYFMPAFWWRMFFAVVFALISQYYFKFADTNHYYQGVLDMHKAVADDYTFLNDIYLNLKLTKDNRVINYFLYDVLGITHMYMYEVPNYFVPRFALPFSLMFGKSYIAISFCMSVYAFGGCWRLFKLFYILYPHLHKKMAIATLFLPSVLFWGGGLMKDTICLGSLGFFLYAAYNVFIRNHKRLISVLIMLATGYLMYYIKAYILICVMPAFLMWIFLRYRVRIQDKTLRQISTGLFTFASVFAGFFLVQSFTASEALSRYSTEKLVTSVQAQQNSFNNSESAGGGSNFTMPKLENDSPLGALQLFPLGVINTFFRPFPWDVRSPFMIFSFLEAVGFLVITIMCFRRVGIGRTFNIMWSDPVLVFCFVFAIMFGGLVGLSTTNFGALVRYKIPCLPFYCITFFVIMDKSGLFNRNIIFSKKFF